MTCRLWRPALPLASGFSEQEKQAILAKTLASGPLPSKKTCNSVAIFGKISENSTTSLPGKPIHKGFSGLAARRARPAAAKAAPTALRPRATCPSCHSGICHKFLPPPMSPRPPDCYLATPPRAAAASAVAGKCDVSLLPAASLRSGHSPLHDETKKPEHDAPATLLMKRCCQTIELIQQPIVHGLSCAYHPLCAVAAEDVAA